MHELILRTLLMGVIATFSMDILAQILKLTFKIPPANWTLIGRWFATLPSGKLFHEDITQSPSLPFETVIGWIAHYAIGILYAAILLVVAGPDWLAAPTAWPALLIGWITVGAGWFLLQPGMGAGWAASKRANKWQIRGLNILAHTIFGLGLYAAALLPL
jgi:Protein of unknown function (DUF2938)